MGFWIFKSGQEKIKDMEKEIEKSKRRTEAYEAEIKSTEAVTKIYRDAVEFSKKIESRHGPIISSEKVECHKNGKSRTVILLVHEDGKIGVKCPEYCGGECEYSTFV